MGLVKENTTYEWHRVQCAKCAQKFEIKIKLGTLMKSKRFNSRDEFVCNPCKKKK